MANTGAYYWIDDVKMPSPVSIEPAREDLDSDASGRSAETGQMIRVVIKAEVRNLEVKHEMLTKAELDTILAASAPKRIKFYYNDGGTMITRYGYINKKKYPCQEFIDDTATGSHWDLSFIFVDNAE